MAMGYQTDERTVNALLDREFRYFGLPGCKTRISKFFDGFRAVDSRAEARLTDSRIRQAGLQ